MFEINGFIWDICFVNKYNPILYDYLNQMQSIAVTDFAQQCIFISNSIDDRLLYKVIKHELYHCYEFSKIAYDLPVYEEEWVADFIAMYGEDLIILANDLWHELCDM